MSGFRNRPPVGRVCHKIELSSLSQRRRSPGATRPAPLLAEPVEKDARPAFDEAAMRLQLERMVAEHIATLPAAGGVDEAAFELLQRRLTKVTDALVGREREVEALRRALEADPGLPSDYEEVQGLSPEAENGEARLEMMKQIFMSNLKLKESLTLNRRPAE